MPPLTESGRIRKVLSLLKTKALRVRVPVHPYIADQSSGPQFYAISCDVYNDMVSLLDGTVPHAEKPKP